MTRHRIDRHLRRVALGAAAALLVGAAAPAAFADDDDRPVTAEERERIERALESRGYTDIHDIEVDDGRFEVDARNPDGHSVDLELDMETLEVVHEKRDD